MKATLHDYACCSIRIIAGTVFLYAGWKKLITPQEFADSIAAYQLLPVQAINLFALTLPPLELMTGCLLLIGFQRRLATFSAMLMIGVFFVALSSAIARGLTIDCGCFGNGASTKSGLWPALFRDLALGAGVFFLYLRADSVDERADVVGGPPSENRDPK